MLRRGLWPGCLLAACKRQLTAGGVSPGAVFGPTGLWERREQATSRGEVGEWPRAWRKDNAA
jgi:hypothetical protein